MPHGHILLLDGGFRLVEDAPPEFVAAPNIGQEELDALAKELHEKLERHLKRRGVTFTTSSTAPGEKPAAGRMARYKGLHLFASLAVESRAELERVCRYLLRSGVDSGRIRELADGQFAFHLERKDADGNRQHIKTGPEWMKMLASLVPAARKPMRRYFGVLAGGHKMRKKIVPTLFPVSARGRPAQEPAVPWRELLGKVFGLSLVACPHCRGPLTVLGIQGSSSRAKQAENRRRELEADAARTLDTS